MKRRLLLLSILLYASTALAGNVSPTGGGGAGSDTTAIHPPAGDITGTAAAPLVTKSNGNLFTSTTFGASLNLSTLLSQDCTTSGAGVVTCTQAGNGTGNFRVGKLGIGLSPGVALDISTGSLAGQPDAASYALSNTRAFYQDSATGNFFGTNLQYTVSAASGSASYEKAGLIIETLSNDISDGTHLRDIVGADIRGQLSATNTLGRAWGVTPTCIIATGGDGLCYAEEDSVTNNGTDQATVGTTTSKYDIHLSNGGTNPTTAGIYLGSNDGKVHTGFYADTGAFSSLTTDNYLALNSLFTVNGQTGIINQVRSANSAVLFHVAQNTSNGGSAQAGFQLQNDTGAYLNSYVTSSGGGSQAFIVTTLSGGMIIGELATASLQLETNSTTRITISSAGDVTVGNGNTISSHGGAVPTISAGCGTSPSAIVGTNNQGNFTIGSGGTATSCTIAFSAAGVFGTAPTCVFSDASASVTPVAFATGATSTSTVVVDFVAATGASKKVNYICMGG